MLKQDILTSENHEPELFNFLLLLNVNKQL